MVDKDKLKAIEKVKAELAEKYKKNIITSGADIHMERLPFGVLAIDRLWGGGPVRGRWNMIYGAKSSGKSSLCCKYIANVQKNGGIAAYIDAEHAYDQNYAASFGVNNDDLIYSKPATLEEGMTTLIKLAPIVDLVIIDSIVAIAPEAEIEREMEQETMALVARKLSQFFRDTTGIVGKSRAAVLLVNQTRTNLSAYVPIDAYPGGQALAHACSFVMHMRRGSPKEDPMGKTIVDSKEKEVAIGKRLYLKAEKTKISANEGTTTFTDLLYDAPHFDEVRDVLTIAQLDGIITRAGAFYYFGENKYQGEQNLMDTLRTNPEMVAKLKEQILNPLKKEEIVEVKQGEENDDHPKTKNSKKKS